ncbi:hypothetical protein STEG23_001136 [Scotinomys teguina]
MRRFRQGSGICLYACMNFMKPEDIRSLRTGVTSSNDPSHGLREELVLQLCLMSVTEETGLKNRFLHGKDSAVLQTHFKKEARPYLELDVHNIFKPKYSIYLGCLRRQRDYD